MVWIGLFLGSYCSIYIRNIMIITAKKSQSDQQRKLCLLCNVRDIQLEYDCLISYFMSVLQDLSFFDHFDFILTFAQQTT